ncbi:MAG: serine--tRNA ligase, partial [Firmicutes bacterium HGW-Firmicutes-13]
MLDLKYIRQNPEKVREALKNKGETADLDKLFRKDEERRELLYEVEQLKNRRNTVSEEIGRKKKSGEDADDMIKEMKIVNEKIKELDDRLKNVMEDINRVLLDIPNVPDEGVPVGKTEED